MADNNIKVFVSYSHDDEAHMQWVSQLVADLRTRGGFIVLFDQDLEKGASLPRFMEKGIEESEKVLVIGTPDYKQKSANTSGVSFEEAIMGTEYMLNIDSTKFYPILRRGSFSTSFPIILTGRNGDDFTDDSLYEKNLQIVIHSILGNRTTQVPITGQILNLCNLSETMPNVPAHESIIDRESELEQIESLLGDDKLNEKKAVFVTGLQGVGVTTLLALFANRHPDHCISFFNDGYTRYSINPGIVEQSLARQAYWYINNSTLQDGVEISFSSLYLRLLQKTKTTPLYFIFDGFEDIPTEYKASMKELFDTLPWGKAKFLFSGEQKSFDWLLPTGKRAVKTETANRLLPFSKPRVKEYFKRMDSSLTDGDLDELYEITRGNADKISGVRSQYLKNRSFAPILNDKDAFSKNIYYAEISRLEQAKDELSNVLLSVVAYADIQSRVDFLSSVLEKKDVEIIELIGKNSDFLYINEQGFVLYRTESLLKYMREYLSDYRSRVEVRLMTVFESNEKMYADALLPLYKKLHKEDALIRLLSDDNIQETLDRERSQATLNMQCDFGYEASILNESFLGDALRFSVLRSTSRQIEQNELWDYETEALVLQGRIDDAMALSQSIYLKEERLKALAIIYRKAKDLPQDKSNLILLAIKDLSQAISFELIPQKSVELARLLLGVDLQLSMEIIERLINDERNNISPDSLYALLSLSLRENYLKDTDATDASNYEQIQAKIQDSELKKMMDAMDMLYSEATADEVLSMAKELKSDTQRVYFLMFWIPGHRKKEKIEKIVLYALNLIVANSNIDIPRINVVQGLFKALPYFPDEESVEQAKKILDSIETDIKTPTFTFVQVKLLLIEAFAKFNEAKAFSILSEVYLFVDEYPDKSVSIDCLALILSAYERLGNKKSLEKELASQNELLGLIKQRLTDAFTSTAFHFNLIKNPIKYLVVDYPSFMEDMVPKMNCESRRSKAYVFGAREYIRRCPIGQIRWDYLDALLSNIKFRKFDVELPLIELALKIKKSKYSEDLLEQVKKRQTKFCSIKDESRRLFALSQIYVWIFRGNSEEPFAKYIAEQIRKGWQSIDSIQTRIGVGYQLVTEISSSDYATAEIILNETLSLKQQAVLSSSSCIEALNDSLDLYTRSVGVMIRSGYCDDKVLSRYKNEVGSLEDVGARIVAWGKISLEFYLVGDITNFKKIVFDEIVTPLENLNKNSYYYSSILCTIAPSLFLYSEHAYSQYMEELDEFFVNACTSHICDFIFYKYPYLSDFEYDKNDIKLTYDEYTKLLTLFSYMTFDEELFVKIDNLCKSLQEKQYYNLSQTQVSSIAKSIRDIADKKFPAPGGIVHDGYKVACYIATHEILNQTNARNVWDEIENQIQSIGNWSDQAFLYFYAIQYVSRKPKQIEFINKGMEVTKNIPVGYDRLTRFAMVLEESLKNCKAQVKELLKTSMDSVKFETKEDYNFFERYTDIAYQLDPKFAEAYLEISDNDTSRQYNRLALKSHVASQKRLQAAQEDISKSLALPSNDYAAFFLKVFSAIVRGKNIAKMPCGLFNLIPSIYNRSLTFTKSAILYIIEDVRRWDEIHKDQKELIEKIYLAMAFNFRVVESLSVNSEASLNRLLHVPTEESETIVRPGERDKGLKVLYEWYKQQNTINLRIIDPYFSAQDLLEIKPLFEFNNDLHVSIVAHAKNEEDIERYREVWNDNVLNLSGCIDITTVCFSDKPDEGPLHDRYWFAQDREKGILKGLKTTSLSNLGKRDSDSEEITDNKAQELYEHLWMFYYDRVRKINGRTLKYQAITI